ncbi:MAG: nitric oxide synthase oxygenase, partial [Verrucomicrobiota bacterium]
MAAREFISQYQSETGKEGTDIDPAGRMGRVEQELASTGTYTHTTSELEWAGRVAWRNSTRCVGRLYWKSLRVLDARDAITLEQQEKA